MAHAKRCEHALLSCPLQRCPFRCKTSDELVDHFLSCPKLYADSALKAEERGPFAVVGKDVLQLIMSNLSGKDVVALAQVNRWFSEQVRHLYGHLRCPHCRYFHSGPLEFHAGLWSGMRFFDVLHARAGIASARMRDGVRVAANVGKKAVLITLASVSGTGAMMRVLCGVSAHVCPRQPLGPYSHHP